MATEKSISTTGITTNEASLFLAGRNLAVVTLNELLAEGDVRCSIEAQFRDGQDQCDTFARAIEILRTAPPAVIKGFGAVFTEIVGASSVGSPVSSEYIERLSIEEMGHTSVARAASH